MRRYAKAPRPSSEIVDDSLVMQRVTQRDGQSPVVREMRDVQFHLNLSVSCSRRRNEVVQGILEYILYTGSRIS